MSNDSLAAFVVDGLAPLGAVSLRKFFGGLGIYLNGLMIGMIIRDELYFKANAQTRARFVDAGSNTGKEGKAKTRKITRLFLLPGGEREKVHLGQNKNHTG